MVGFDQVTFVLHELDVGILLLFLELEIYPIGNPIGNHLVEVLRRQLYRRKVCLVRTG